MRAAPALAALLLCACAVRGGRGASGVIAEVVEPPRAVATPRGALAVWELHVRNDGESPVRIERVSTGAAAYEGGDLARRVVPRRREPDPERRLDLAPSEKAVVLLEAVAPGVVRHDVVVRAVGERGGSWTETVAAADVATDVAAPIELAPPLAGGGWLVSNGPASLSGHRRAVVWTRGRPRAAQRFSVDFFRVGADGGALRGDPKRNESYLAWGADVLAVADAVVAAAVDGIPDNVPDLRERAVGMTNETVAGNHVVLDLGGGRFAMYAHLRSGSVRVRQGDRVARGRVLGALGNSGNSTEPHLHFHVADGPSPVDASGLPFVVDAFESRGAQLRSMLPAEDSVVAFRAADQTAAGAPTDSATK